MKSRVTFCLFWGVIFKRLLYLCGIGRAREKDATPGTTSAWTKY